MNKTQQTKQTKLTLRYFHKENALKKIHFVDLFRSKHAHSSTTLVTFLIRIPMKYKRFNT